MNAQWSPSSPAWAAGDVRTCGRGAGAGGGCSPRRVLGREREEAGGRRRLGHVLDVEAGRGHRVHVAAERAVDEGDEHVLLDLLDRLVLDQVGADPPVLLGRVEDLVVDPAAVRRLQERVVEEEEEDAAGPQDAGDLDDGRVHAADVLEDQAGDDGVEAAVGERQRVGPRLGVGRTAAPLPRHPDLVPRRVDADDHVGTDRPGQPRHLTLAAAHVEHVAGPDQVLGREGQDLLVVLRIGALGEAGDPPVGVGLPQVTHGASRGPRCRPRPAATGGPADRRATPCARRPPRRAP